VSATLVLLLIASQVLLVAGQLFLKHALNLTDRAPRPWPGVMLHFALFITLMTFWFLLWLGFLQKMPLSQVLPWEGLSPMLLILGAAIFLREKIKPGAWLGMALISAGIVLVSLS
jgi:undecaprenyl phosphate-alpha-L-ara4N flippase subunit ArnE